MSRTVLSRIDLNGVTLGDNIENSAYPSSRYLAWVPSRPWWLYRSIPTLVLIGVWGVIFYAFLSFIPILFPVVFPAYALPIMAASAALFTYLFAKTIRHYLIEPIYSSLYKFVLKYLFAKSESEATEISAHLAEERTLAQQLVDYGRYFLNLRLRQDSDKDERLRIRIAKFNVRWGSVAKLILNSFFLVTGAILLVPLIFGIPLTSALVIGMVAFGIFGGICSSLVAGNLLGNGLVALAKTSVQVDEKPKQLSMGARIDRTVGIVVSLAHGIGGGAACFAASMQLTMMFSSFSLIAANPVVIPLILTIVGLLSLAIARGYYALTRKVWDNKASYLKGFFRGTDGEGKPVGNFQRLFGVLGAVLIGATISLAFVMLNGSSFANIVQFPIYDIIGSAIQFNLNPAAVLSFALAGVIGGIGVGVIYFTGVFKLSSDLGKLADKGLSSQAPVKVVYNDQDIEVKTMDELRDKFAFKLAQNEGPVVQDNWSSWLYRKHWNVERLVRSPIIIIMNALATGMLSTVPNILLLQVLAPQMVVPVAMILFSITAFASMCKDYLNWLPGYENPSHAYTKIKEALYRSKLLAKQQAALRELLSQANQLIEAAKQRLAEVPSESVEQETAPMLAVVPAYTITSVAEVCLDPQIRSSKFWTQLKTYALEFEEIKYLSDNEVTVTYLDLSSKLEKAIEFCNKQSAESKKSAEALRDGYDPHFYGLALTGIVRIISNTLALLLMPIVCFFPEEKMPLALPLPSPRGGPATQSVLLCQKMVSQGQ